MAKTVDTVERERERERERASFKEISFICCVKKSVLTNTRRIEKIKTNKIVINKKDGLYSKERLLYSLSFLCE